MLNISSVSQLLEFLFSYNSSLEVNNIISITREILSKMYTLKSIISVLHRKKICYMLTVHGKILWEGGYWYKPYIAFRFLDKEINPI